MLTTSIKSKERAMTVYFYITSLVKIGKDFSGITMNPGEEN